MVRSQSNSRKAKPDTPEYTEVKQRVVDAAIELIADHGFNRFRFEELAEKVGYNRATLYRYFDSKEDLIADVMLSLMQEITHGIIHKTANQKVTRKNFADELYNIAMNLRHNRRYAIVMDVQNVELFARLTHEYFAAITSSMLEKFMMDNPAGPVLKEGIAIGEAVHWLMHQIISYGFFGIQGENERQKKAYLEKMVVSVII
jgi:AcrR family transcriptional regulator